MRHPQGSVFVIPLRPRKLILPGLLLAGLLALLLCRPSSTEARYAPVPADPPPELRIVPPDTIVVFHLNLANLLNKDLAKAVLPLLESEGPGTRYRFGVPLSQIDGLAALTGDSWSANVVTTRKEYDREKVRQAFAPRSTEMTYKDKKIQATDGGPRFKDRGIKDRGFVKEKDFRKEGFQEEKEEVNIASWAPAVYFLSERTFVAGDGRGIMNFIDRGEKPGEKHPLQDVMATAGKHHVTAGFHIREELTREAEMSFRQVTRFDPFTASMFYNFKPLVSTRHGLITADLGDELRLEGKLDFPTARLAEQSQDAVRVSLLMARGSLLMLEDQLSDQGNTKDESSLNKLLQPLYRALTEAPIKQDGSSVKVSVKATIDDKLVKAVVAEAAPRVHLAANLATTTNNFKQIGLTIVRMADDANGKMPSSVVYSKDGKPLYSWRVHILPYLGEKELYNKLKLDEPWDSEHNKPLLARMPKVFEMPGVKAAEGMTYFQIFEGAGTMASPQRGARYPTSFTDGTSQTILIVEAAEPVHWAAPKDIDYSARLSPLKQIGRHYGKFTLAVMADCSVHRIPAGVSEETMRAAITPAAGDILGSDWDEESRGGDKDKVRRDFGKDKDKDKKVDR
jgi:hypothetical protein